MKTKIMFLLVAVLSAVFFLLFFVLFFTSCENKNEVPVVVKVEKPSVTQRKFASYLVSRLDVKNMRSGDSLMFPINRDKVITSERSAVVRCLKDSCDFYYLESKLRQVYLSAVWVGNPNGGSDLEITNYESFIRDNFPGERFYIRDPKPKEIQIGNSINWVGSRGQLWKTR
jgi:hypothetical protein